MRKCWKIGACLVALSLLAACGTTAVSPVPSAAATPEPSSAVTPALTSASTQTPAEKNTFRLTREEFPRLDGSTSTAPLARAVCSVLLGEKREETADLINFSRTTQAYRQLMHGYADLLIAAEPADTVVEEVRKSAFEWEMTPIATDALVFLVNEDNPVDSLTAEQVQKIYTGEITNWKEVGGEDRAIIPFQRNAEAGSQTLMKKLVMGDLELMEPPTEYIVGSMAGLIEAVRSFDGSPGAIGYTVYYYANDMNMADGLKVVAIDGAKPDAATIRSGDYPFTNPYYAVIDEIEPDGSTVRQIYEWLQGPVGQSLIQHEGYVPVQEDPAVVEWDLGETAPLTEIYTRLSAEPMTELVPSDDYGPLLTYVGAVVPDEWGDLERYGLVTREGMMVTDPIYDWVGRLSYYNGSESVAVDLLRLTRTIGTPAGQEQRSALAAPDGSWVTGFDWLWAEAVSSDRIWVVEPSGDGVMLDLELNELWRLPLSEEGDVWDYQGGINGGMGWLNGTAFFRQGVVDLEGTILNTEENGVSTVGSFHDGLAIANRAGNWQTWGYINKAGEWGIEPAYSAANDFHNGKAIVVTEGGGSRIIDTEGNLLLEADGKFQVRSSPQGDWYMNYTEVFGSQTVQYLIGGVYDQDLNPLEWDWVGERAFWGGDSYMWRTTGNGVEVGNPYESTFFPVSDDAELYIEDDDIILFLHGDWEGWSAWDMDGNCLFPETECDYLNIVEDSLTGERYFCVQTEGRYVLYDLKGKFLTDCGSGWPHIWDGLLSVQTDLSYGYKNLDGEWVFRISLMKSQGD